MLIFLFVFLLIAILILVHEFGHFWTARRFGVKIEEFSVGFGRKIWSRTQNGVRYSLRAIPFGGYVRMYGERGEGEGDARSFISKPAWQRFVVLLAGVGMNFVAAWFFFSIAVATGIPEAVAPDAEGGKVTIVAVSPQSPAEQAGIRIGDQIVGLEAEGEIVSIKTEESVTVFVRGHLGTVVTVRIQRGGSDLVFTASPRADPPEGEGPLGIALARVGVVRVPWWKAPIAGTEMLVSVTGATVRAFAEILRLLAFQFKAPDSLAGPVGIFVFASDIAALGFSHLLQFAGVISVNLAVLNLLPIPVLDGGWVALLFVEKLRGKRLRPRAEGAILTAGFAFLLVVMAAATYQDITRYGDRLFEGIGSILSVF